MRNYARIDNGLIAEFLETDGDITQMFPPIYTWVDVTELIGLKVGWTAVETDGEWSFSAPVIIPPDETQLAYEARAERERQLRAIYDPGINMALRALRMASTQEEQSYAEGKVIELDNYAQSLEDIPDQPGFPQTIDWPTAPTR